VSVWENTYPLGPGTNGIGHDSEMLPPVGFGTWRLRGSACSRAVAEALEVGYRHIDTATMYENEREVGRAVAGSGVPREEVLLATKLPPDHAGRERRTLEASLRALGVDYVDLWLIHWPPGRGAGIDTWERFLALRDEGLVRAVGVSNYAISQLDELARATGEAPAVNQIRWGPSIYDAEVLGAHRRRNVILEGYSPFKSTDLGHPVLAEVAGRHGVTPAQVVLRWHVDRAVPVIPKSANRERIASNFDVFGFSLDDDELRRIDGLGR
jgi:2,5-diketo-D-gluconate reductase A